MKLVLAIVQDDDAIDLIEELNNIKSKYGKYSIIGNHDHVKDINLLKITQDYLISIKNTYNMLNNYVITPLKANHEQVNFNLQLNRKSGLTYYDNICFELEVVFTNGKNLVLVDGGINDWIGKILSDSKEKCITSGMGLEYLGRVYTRKL